MAAGQGNVITGFIEGLIKQNQGVAPKVLPFADKVGGATLTYSSENITVETFSAAGIKGASGSCPFREELSIELTSDNLAWSFLQAAMNTLAEDSDRPVESSLSVVLEDVTGTAPNEVSSYVLPFEVSAAGSVFAADEDGIQYDVTAVVGTGVTTVSFDDDYTGQKVTIFYSTAPAGTNNLIKIGSGTKLGEIGVYGRFFGCPDSLLVAIPRGIIQSNVSLATGDAAASAAMTIQALRDPLGNYAYLQRI